MIASENDGRKLDHATLEVLPVRAVEQVEAGEHPEVVAAALGMARGHGVRVAGQVPGGRPQALRARPVPGQPPKLNGAQLRRLYTLIVGG